MRLTILASGSSANCMIVELDGVTVMLDAGLAYKDTVARIIEAGIDPESISGVLLTHAHVDHAGCAKTVSRKFGTPVYMSHGCFSELKPEKMPAKVIRFQPWQSFKIGNLRVTPIEVPHDAAQPVAFKLGSGGEVFTLATDLGSIPAEVDRVLRDASTICLESNHDHDLVALGEKHPAVIRRVLGPGGHLSNDAVANFLKTLNGERRVILAHLSAEDNIEFLARKTAERAADGRFTIEIAQRAGGTK